MPQGNIVEYLEGMALDEALIISLVRTFGDTVP